MRKKKMIFVTIFLLFVFTAIGIIRIHSEATRKEYISEYLENQYAGNFQLVTCKKEQEKYNLSFETKDSNKIRFQVKYWIGGYVTALGEITWIFQKHIVDDFPTLSWKFYISKICSVMSYTIDSLIIVFVICIIFTINRKIK